MGRGATRAAPDLGNARPGTVQYRRMNDLVLLLILVSLALIYVSVLLAIRLGSLGVPRRVVRQLIIEVWLTFALIIGVMALARAQLGHIARAPNLGQEMLLVFRRWNSLPAGPRLLLLGGLVLALILFAHLIWSLRSLPREASEEGDSHDAAGA